MGRYRDQRITVRLTEHEKEILYRQMKRAGNRNVSDFIMTAACTHRSTVIDTSPILEIKGELSRIGNNVNQIAKVANTTHSIFADDVDKLKGELTAVRDLVEKAFGMCIEGRRMDIGIHENSADKDEHTFAASV